MIADERLLFHGSNFPGGEVGPRLQRQNNAWHSVGRQDDETTPILNDNVQDLKGSNNDE